MAAVRGDRTAATAAARAFELAVAAASVAVVAAAAALIRPADAGLGAVLVLALGLTAAPFVLVVVASRPRSAASPGTSGAGPAAAGRSPTTMVRVGGEPLDLVVACVAISIRAGPVVLVTAGRPELDDVAEALAVPLVRDTTIELAVTRAAHQVTTDCVLVVQPGAVPLAEAGRRASTRLATDNGWVIASAREFDDGYAPEGREILGARLRGRARQVGLLLWERDATIVRTSLLRAFPLAPRRPWGTWLRAARRRGYHGTEDPDDITLRTAPAGVSVFWPATVSRQRATAADLADSLTEPGARRRLVAAGLLLRELYAYPLAVLFATPVLVGLAGSFPLRVPAAPAAAVVLTSGAARWAAWRVPQGLPLHPLRDVVAAVYEAPGSIRALFAACSRRLAPTRVHVSQRTLVWGALALSAATVIPLLDRRSGDPDLEVAAGLSAWVLVLLWLLAIRLVAARRWTRATPRLAARAPAVVDGVPGHTLDVGTGGVAVVLDGSAPAVGAEIPVRIELPGTVYDDVARVADRRMAGGREVVGLAFPADITARARWARTAFAAATLDVAAPVTTAAGERERGAERTVRVLDRIALTLAATFAALALVALSLSAAGYRPLVVRSASMQPTLRTGDLILVDDVPARTVQVGDVVTFIDADGDDVTHRVRAVTRDGSRLQVKTRGDANDVGEEWTVGADETVGRLAVRLPVVGRYVAWLRGPDAVWALLALAGLLLAASLARAGFVAWTRNGPGRARAV